MSSEDFGPCCPCSVNRHHDCITGPCQCKCGRPNRKDVIDFTPTERGFIRGSFTDSNGKACTVQDSSVATEACLWLGLETVEVKTFREREGWRNVELPSDAHVFSRMHLTVSQAAAIRDALDRFVKTGSCEP